MGGRLTPALPWEGSIRLASVQQAIGPCDASDLACARAFRSDINPGFSPHPILQPHPPSHRSQPVDAPGFFGAAVLDSGCRPIRQQAFALTGPGVNRCRSMPAGDGVESTVTLGGTADAASRAPGGAFLTGSGQIRIAADSVTCRRWPGVPSGGRWKPPACSSPWRATGLT